MEGRKRSEHGDSVQGYWRDQAIREQPAVPVLGKEMEKLNGFYQSPEWVKCRRAYIAYSGGLCERCKAKGIIQAGRVVHHKIHLTAENYTRPEISLSFQNLELLCQSCHEEEHRGKRRYSFTEDGMVVERRQGLNA